MPSQLPEDDQKRQREAEMADAVLGYIAERPEAMDTAAAIAEWWVMRQQVRLDVESLTGVLERLKEQGVLERIGSGEQAKYRLRRA